MVECLIDKIVKTRKPHRCFGCNREFEKGASMRSSTCVDGGEIYTVYLCDTCQEYVKKYISSGDEYYQGDLRNNRETWELVRKQVEDK